MANHKRQLTEKEKTEVLNLINLESIRKGLKVSTTVFVDIICDCCGQTFSKKINNILRNINGFGCTCNSCRSKINGSKIAEKSKQTFLRKYGVSNPSKLDSVNSKRKQTCVEKYGGVAPACSDSVKEKSKQTCIKKYGVSNISQSSDFKDRVIKGCQKKYGVDSHNQLDVVKEKKKQTSLKKYGTTCTLQSPEVNLKARQTSIERYGTEYPSQSLIVKNKAKQTSIERYGVSNVSKSDLIKNKVKKTNLEKYGVESYSQTREFKQKISTKWKLMWENMPIEKRLEIRKKASTKWKLMWENMAPERKLDIRKKASSKYNYQDIKFDSSWELAFFLYLLANGLEFEYQIDPIPYQDEDGTKHFYIPDFKVGDQLIEIKGDHFFTKDGRFINPFDRSEKMDSHCNSKQKCMESNNVKILKGVDMKPILDWVEEFFGKDFLNNCRNQKCAISN